MIRQNLSFLTLIAFSTVAASQEEHGLGKEFHQGRRAELMQRGGESLMIFRGLSRPRTSGVYQQDETFWYLTGIESPDAVLLLDAKSGREILLLPPADPAGEFRAGSAWDAKDHWIERVTGFRNVVQNDPETNTELFALLGKLLGERKTIGVALYPTIVSGDSHHRAFAFERRRSSDRLDGRANRARTLAERLEHYFDVEVVDVAPILREMRLRKTPAELAALTAACRSACMAIDEAMRSTRPGLPTSHLRALMNLTQVRAGADGFAFQPVIQGGMHATMLQKATDAELKASELVLVEFGSEVDHYASKMTRTWPVDGSFSGRQAELYDAVLAALKAGIAAARPGAKLVDVDGACTSVLKERGFFGMRRHFSCHFVGLEPVDPAIRRPFEPGVVISIGPGLYDRKNGIGVRIEDVVVITEKGARVLTGDVPKERSEIEARMHDRGVFDWIGELDD